MRGLVVLSGSSHPELAGAIAKRLGIEFSPVTLSKFANGESNVDIGRSVREMNVFIIQTGFGHVNDHFIELLIMIHACKIASAAKVIAVIPCFPYSRQVSVPYEKPMKTPLPPMQEALLPLFRDASREINGYRTWSARPGTLIADLLMTAGLPFPILPIAIVVSGADHIITLDLHNPQFQGYFDIPVDNLISQPLMIRYIKENIANYKDAVIVSPDAGGAQRATEISTILGMEFALIHKDRRRDAAGSKMMLVGNVKDRNVIMIDDMADTCFTLSKAASILRKHGAHKILAVITHGVFSGESLQLINESSIDEIIVSNTIPQSDHLRDSKKVKVFDVAPMLAESIRRTHNGESVSFLFNVSCLI